MKLSKPAPVPSDGAPGNPPLFSKRALTKLIAPLMIEQLLAVTVGIADTVMITRVGEAAVSGISLVDHINNLIIQILAALATGGAVVVSQYLGRQEPHNARKAAKQLLYVSLSLALVFTGIALGLRRTLLSLVFGSIDAQVMDNALTYLMFTACSFPFLALYNACAALFRAQGNSRVSMRTSLLMNLINIGGNAYLIYVRGWGVAGAATATLISRAVAAVILLMMTLSPRNPLQVERLARLELNGPMIKSILRIGIPTGFENGMFQFGRLAVQAAVSTLGTAAIAANAIASTISNLFIVPGASIGIAMITVVGQCVGAGDYDQAVSYTRRLMGLVYLTGFLINFPFLFCGEPFVALFGLSPDAARIVVELLPLLCILRITIWPLAFPFPNVLRAAGDARFTMTASMLSMWIVRVGLCYLLIKGFGFGVEGVWYSMYADWLVRDICFVSRYFSGKWKTKKVID